MKREDLDKVAARISALSHRLSIHLFTQNFATTACVEARELAESLAEASELLELHVHDFVAERPVAHQMGVERIPAFVLEGKDGARVRFFGVPVGYELSVLVEDIVDVARGEAHLQAETVRRLREVERPIGIQVFSSPTSPEAANAVRLAHQFAIASPWVNADAIQVSEFPELVYRHEVGALPKTIVNEGEVSFEGSLSEAAFLERILSARYRPVTYP